MEFFNVLLIGQISAGKSAFYNTVETVFSKNVTMRADMGTLEKSLTTKFRTYKVKAKDAKNKPIRFRFCDTMGLSATSGLTPEDLGIIMDGHVASGTYLGGKEGLVPGIKGYNEEPETEDKMHCVVLIVEATRVNFMDDKIIKMFNNIREQASRRSK